MKRLSPHTEVILAAALALGTYWLLAHLIWLVAAVRRVPVLAALIPPTADRPLLGRMATYRLEYIGPPPCLPSCEPVAPWRFLNGGS